LFPTTTEITIFSPHTTLAVVAEEEALVPEVVEALAIGEAPAIGVVLTVPMLPKVKIAASSKHDTPSFMAFLTTFGMSI
jgi:hypothetical protein